MEVEFESEKTRQFCEDTSKLQRKYGKQAQKITLRIQQLCSAPSLADLQKLPQVRLHPMTGNYQGCLSLDLFHPYRMLILPLDGTPTDYSTITKVKIEEICIDTH